jgi:NitT/TauT family transport system substrate-binding protein
MKLFSKPKALISSRRQARRLNQEAVKPSTFKTRPAAAPQAKTFAVALAAYCGLATNAFALDNVTFGTNWLAEAEHGGYYQALVDGTYEKYGLNVKILPGGPQANNRLLLVTGKIDFFMGGNLISAFTSVEQGVPTIVVAASFQKDPLIFMAHPGQGRDKLEDLKKGPIFVGQETLATAYQWLKSAYGFSESNVKPYNFNPAPFIADKASSQQGYATSEPFAVEKQGGFKPNVFLLADNGYDTYSTTIETRTETVEKRADVVQRFIDASAIGWYNYLYHDSQKANALIKKENPEMDDAQLAYSIGKMKEYGIVDSGDSLDLGLGAMTDVRVKSFYDKMAKAGVVKADLDLRKAYTLQFVNKSVGVELRPQ